MNQTAKDRAIEILAVIFTIACVWLTAEERMACWPTGIVGCLLYICVFYKARLYSDVLLQLYFLLTSIWGWYNWAHGGARGGALSVGRLSSGEIGLVLIIVMLGTAALGRLMQRYTRAALPYWDAATTVLSFVAQYLLTYKVLENWALWIVADIIDTGIYFSRRLYATSLLYAVLLVLAIRGLLEWLTRI